MRKRVAIAAILCCASVLLQRVEAETIGKSKSSPTKPAGQSWSSDVKSTPAQKNSQPSSILTNEMLIKRKLMHNYDHTSRPVSTDADNITAMIGISLYHILDTMEKQQTITAVYSVRMQWKDHFLRWNPAEYGNVSSIWIPSRLVWRPDIVIINLAQDEFKEYMNTNMVVSHTGEVLWMFPVSARTTCRIDVRYFPLDEQHCKLSFISWTYSGKELDLRSNPALENAIYFSSENQEWNVTRIHVERHEKTYACCPGTFYPDVTFTIIMRRRSLFHILNLVLPALLIYFVAIIGFLLPLKTEKVNTETTVLLTLVVFLLMVSEILPPTPDSVPVLSLMFLTILHMVSLAIVMAVCVTNIYYRPRFKPLPQFGKWMIKIMFKEYYTLCYEQSDATQQLMRCEQKQNSAGFQTYVAQVDSHKQASAYQLISAGSSCRRNGVEPSSVLPGASLVNMSDDHCRLTHLNSLTTTTTTTKQPNLKDMELNEWQVFAECLDRVFFVIFIILSLILALLFTIQLWPMMFEHD